MPPQRPQPINLAREFRVEELFFSITDEKGVIRHGNDVFCRISGYTEEQLFGAAHNIIRHPDMPRCVFQLLWDRIQDSQTLAAYVKNLASDGRYYWVLAVVMPCRGGYLSVRLKPTGPLLHAVTRLYADLLAEEQRNEATGNRRDAIAASLASLEARLPTLGFASYDAFMLHALSEEVSCRHAAAVADPGASRRRSPAGAERLELLLHHLTAADRSLQGLFDQLDEFKRSSHTLSERSARILDTTEEIRLLALNASISANRLGAQGDTLRVVARSLGTTSTDVETVVRDLTAQARDVVTLLDGLRFSVAATKLQGEVACQFARELRAGSDSEDSLKAASLAILLEEMRRRAAAVDADLRASQGGIEGLGRLIQALLRRNRALRFVETAGRKETASRQAESMGALFDATRSHVDSTHEDCRILDQTIATIRRRVADMLEVEGALLLHVSALEDQQPLGISETRG